MPRLHPQSWKMLDTVNVLPLLTSAEEGAALPSGAQMHILRGPKAAGFSHAPFTTFSPHSEAREATRPAERTPIRILGHTEYTPQIHVYPQPHNMTLFGNRIFASVTG